MANTDTTIVIKAKDETAAAFKSVEGGLTKLGGLMATGAAAAAAAIAAGAAALGSLTKQSMEAMDQLAKTADRLGITTQALAGLRHAGELAGVSIDKMDNSLEQMSRRIAEAAHGSGEARGALNALGLSAQELARVTPDESFKRVADAMDHVGNRSERLRLAYELFGRQGAELINVMEGGRAALTEAAQDAQRLGLAVSRIDAAKIEMANDAWTRTKSALSGVGNTLAVQLAPYLKAAADWLTELVARNNGFREAITTGMQYAAKAVGFLGDSFRGLQVVWKILEVAWASWELAIYSGIAALDETLTEFANKLPGMKFEPNADLQAWAQYARLEVDKTKEELEKLLMEPLPSDHVEAAFQQIAEQAQAAAQKIAAARNVAMTPGQLMPGSEEDDAKADERFQAKFEALAQQLLTEEEALNQSHLNRSLMLEDAYMRDLISQQRYAELSAVAEQQYQDKLFAIRNKGVQNMGAVWRTGLQGQLTVMGQFFGTMSGLMASGSKKQFEIGKKAAIAQTTIDTIQSAMAVFRGFSSIPIVGSILGAIAAAAVVAMGMANVQKIRSQQFDSGSAATPVFSASPVTGIPSGQPGGDVGVSEPPPNPMATAPTGQPRNVNITLVSDSGQLSTEWVRDVLIPRINEQVGDGVILRAT